ncbi:MAG: DUF2062 domain-containing protein [Gammaproteobacteria bacterium]|nr:DUF2062 domain-containing protein [Gammaproteobacteria bacterium]
MPKNFIKRFMPDHQMVRNHRHLRFLGNLLHDPNLFHLNRRSASGAFGVGVFVAFVPVPFQMVLAAAFAVLFRVNLPISVALVWLTNPVTMPPMFYFVYKVGAWLLDTPARELQFQATPEWLMQEIGAIWQPFLLGSFVVGILCAFVSYFAVRGLWRLRIVRHWQRKKDERAARQDF